MSWGYVAVGVGTAVAGYASSEASKDGADAANNATAQQRAAYDQIRGDQEGARQLGNSALNQIAAGFGYGPLKTEDSFDAAAYLAANPDVAAYAAANSKDPWSGDPMDPTKFAINHYFNQGKKEGRAFTGSQQTAQQAPSSGSNDGEFNRDFTLADFQKDPGYEFRLNQGLDSVQGSRAARGSMLSGATLKALQDYGSDYASGEYGKAYDRFNNDRTQRFNRLATVAGIGQTATNNVGTAGANFANSAAGNTFAGANASASGTVGAANAITGGLSNLQSLYQLNNMNRGAGPSSASGSAGWGTGDYYGNQDQGLYL